MRGTRQIFKLGYFFQIFPKTVATRQCVVHVKSLNWVTFFKFSLESGYASMRGTRQIFKLGNFFKFFLRQWPRVNAWYASNL